MSHIKRLSITRGVIRILPRAPLEEKIDTGKRPWAMTRSQINEEILSLWDAELHEWAIGWLRSKTEPAPLGAEGEKT